MHGEVPLVRVVQRQEEIGRLAVDLLMERIEGRGPKHPRMIAVSPNVVDDLSVARRGIEDNRHASITGGASHPPAPR